MNGKCKAKLLYLPEGTFYVFWTGIDRNQTIYPVDTYNFNYNKWIKSEVTRKDGLKPLSYIDWVIEQICIRYNKKLIKEHFVVMYD